MDISKFWLDESVLEFDVHIDTLVTKKLSHVTETDAGESVWHVTKEMAWAIIFYLFSGRNW